MISAYPMNSKTALQRPAVRARLLRLAATVAALAACHGLCGAQGVNDEQINALINESIQERRNGQYDKSIRTLEKALELSRGRKSLDGELGALAFLSLTYRLKGDHKKVLELRLESLKIVRAHPDLFMNRNRNEEPWELGRVSGAYVGLKDFPNALKYARAAVDSGMRFPEMGPVGMGRLRQQLGILLFLVGKYKEAERYLRLAYDDFELRAELDVSFETVISKTYEFELGLLRWLQRDLIAQGRTDEALEIAERSRSRALAALVASRMGPGAPRVPQPPTLEQIKAAARSHNATLVEYSVVYEYDPDLLLEFSHFVDIRAAAVFAWVIKPDGSITFRQMDLSSTERPLNELVAEARFSIGARGRGAKRDTEAKIVHPLNSVPSNPALRALDRILIQPIRDQLPANAESPVVFIPQDTLFLVPFAALQDESGRYLVEKHTSLVGVSVATLALSAEQQRRVAAGGGTGVLVVGNPVMPSLRVKEGQPLVPLPDLPAAEQEAMEIAELFSAKALIGSEATKENVVARMPSARILHFATHGLLDRESEGYLSALALAPAEGDAGFLTMREIEKMKLSAELAVLSACDTAQGQLTGDGVLGFSRAFMAAGVPSLVVSLWAIPDAPTAMLMREFYRGLLQKRDKAQALRQATLLTMKKYPDPGNWAAFELIGEHSTSGRLLAAMGESPAAAGSGEDADNAGIENVFIVPEGIWNYMETPNRDFGTRAVKVLFNSSMSIAELVKFYREAYSRKGLREVEELTRSNLLVFRGSWRDRQLVIGVADMSNLSATAGRIVSIQFERIR